MGFLSGRSFFVEGLFARMMYRSLRLMHEQALGGTRRAVLGLSLALWRSASTRR